MSDLHDALRADVLAAGTVLRRPDGAIALIHRDRYGDWTLPKGKLEHGESLAECALRETWEETGIGARLGARLGDIRYTVPEGRKLVRFWGAEALVPAGGLPEFAANEEVDELRWVAPAEAATLVSYPHDAHVLGRFTPPASVLLVTRHAKAGNRRDWAGDDDLRPLSGAGLAQAEHLVGFLGRWAPERFHSALPLRCRDTIAPFVGDRGPIVPEPLLGEEGYWKDPGAGLARFRELLGTPGVTLLSSQGGVIPDVVASVLEEVAVTVHVTGVPDPAGKPVPSRKASTWVLTAAADGSLLTADYYPTPG